MGANRNITGADVVAQWLESLPVTHMPNASHLHSLADLIENAIADTRGSCSDVIDAASALISYSIHNELDIEPYLHSLIEKIVETVIDYQARLKD